MPLAELLPKLQELSRAHQLRVIEFLATKLYKQETLSLLEDGQTYEVRSPYDAFEAAHVLSKMLEEDNALFTEIINDRYSDIEPVKTIFYLH